MGIADGVAVRLAALCLDRKGRLADYVVRDSAAQGALLVDLALLGRLGQDADSSVVDGTPTGFSSADRLLELVAVEPDRSLDWWVDRGVVRLEDGVAANAASGRWSVRRPPIRRCYRDLSGVRDRSLDPRRPDPGRAPGTSAVMALVLVSGAVTSRLTHRTRS